MGWFFISNAARPIIADRQAAQLTMDANRTKNMRATVDALSESLTTAWCYLILLRSLRDAYHSNPRMNLQFGRVINRYYGALWDALFSRIGTYFDRTAGTHSLPALLTQLRRTKDVELVSLAASIQPRVNEPGEAIVRLLRWRHEVVSHRPSNLVPSKFDQEAGVHTDDAAAALELVEEHLNRIAQGALGFTIDIKHWNEDYALEAADYLGLVESALELQAKPGPQQPGAA